MAWLAHRTTVWALISGLALGLAFPRPDHGWLAWFALVPLFLVMERRPFRSGFIAGLSFFGLVFYWVNIVMTTYGKLNPVLSGVAYLLMVSYLALYFGAATWAACRLREKISLPPVLALPVLWVALEFLRAFLMTGFPWASIGYSQQGALSMIQSADLFGVYGIGFLLAASNAVLAEAVRSIYRRELRMGPWLAAGLVGLVVLGNWGYGKYRLKDDLARRDDSLNVALIQGNIDQAVKWQPGMRETTVEKYLNLSLEADRAQPADLIVWPEAATPFYLQDIGPLSRKVLDLPRRADAYLLTGSPAYETVNQQQRSLNSAFLLSQRGNILGRSDKVHLVPFGEYVPLGTLLPFIDKMVAGIGDFSPGTIVPLPMDGHKLGVLVCYEVIFPELAREWVREGSDLLVNITNDAWFGHSSAPYQHLAMARFRAVENRIWLVRAANTGITAIIDPAGRIVAQTPIFETGFLNGRVGLGAQPTLYTRIGDVLPLACLLLAVYWLIRTRRRYR